MPIDLGDSFIRAQLHGGGGIECRKCVLWKTWKKHSYQVPARTVFFEDDTCTMVGTCCFGAAIGDLFAGARGDQKLDDEDDLGTVEGVVKYDVSEAPILLL
jgi:hypothetical protein